MSSQTPSNFDWALAVGVFCMSLMLCYDDSRIRELQAHASQPPLQTETDDRQYRKLAELTLRLDATEFRVRELEQSASSIWRTPTPSPAPDFTVPFDLSNFECWVTSAPSPQVRTL